MATFTGPNIVIDGLKLHLDALNPLSYSGSGTTWYDLSQSKIDATFVNTITTSSQYFSTNGSNSYIRIAAFNQSIDNTNNTFSMWFKCPTTPAGNRPVLSDNYGPEFGIWKDQSNNIRFYVYGASPATTVANNEWVNITGSWFAAAGNSGGSYQRSTWVNGVQIETNATGTVGNGLSDTPYIIGADPNGSVYLPVDVAIVMHYDRRLSDFEVKQNYNAYRTRFSL